RSAQAALRSNGRQSRRRESAERSADGPATRVWFRHAGYAPRGAGRARRARWLDAGRKVDLRAPVPGRASEARRARGSPTDGGKSARTARPWRPAAISRPHALRGQLALRHDARRGAAARQRGRGRRRAPRPRRPRPTRSGKPTSEAAASSSTWPIRRVNARPRAKAAEATRVAVGAAAAAARRSNPRSAAAAARAAPPIESPRPTKSAESAPSKTAAAAPRTRASAASAKFAAAPITASTTAAATTTTSNVPVTLARERERARARERERGRIRKAAAFLLIPLLLRQRAWSGRHLTEWLSWANLRPLSTGERQVFHARPHQNDLRQLQPRELYDDQEQADHVRKVRDQEVLPGLSKTLPAQRRQDLEGLTAAGPGLPRGLGFPVSMRLALTPLATASAPGESGARAGPLHGSPN